MEKIPGNFMKRTSPISVKTKMLKKMQTEAEFFYFKLGKNLLIKTKCSVNISICTYVEK